MADEKDFVYCGIDEWIDSYLHGEINSATFSILITLKHFREKNFCGSIEPSIVLITSSLTKRHLTPKEEQQIKGTLDKIKKVCSDSDLSDDEKAKIIEDYADEMHEIFVLISSNSNPT